MAQLQCDLPGQFVLLQDSEHVPDGWNIRQRGHWLLATHSSLPVIYIFTNDFIHLGWLLGYPISLDTQLLTEKVVFPINSNNHEIRQSIEVCLYELGGRFLAIFLNHRISSVYLDPCGSLAVVYCLDKPIVASSPALILMNDRHNDYDNELIEELGMPKSDKWYPSGLTPKKRVRRILPNHYLELSSLKVIRHWPGDNELRVDTEINEPVKEIVKLIKNNIYGVENSFPLHMSLTAGRDSRMLLACAKEVTSRIDFFTICDKAAEIDLHIASKIANYFNLNCRFLQVEAATKSQLRDWFTEISHLNTYLLLDLTYIEQRLGCWGGPQHYGHLHSSALRLFPFCHRKIFELMLKLPYEYRQRQELTIDIIRQEWPELLSLPFNSFTGIRAYIEDTSKTLKKIKKMGVSLFPK